jgi:hypothetical protein
MISMNRRSLITGLIAFAAAPAIVRASPHPSDEAFSLVS